MQISRRLQALAEMVTTGGSFADVGTDHAYVPIYLMDHKKIDRAIAMDVRTGPLSRAKENIAAAGYAEYIKTRLSDGLDKLSCGEADTILIAGMGGPLMARILDANPNVARSAKELILQPQSEIKEFREYLAQVGFEVIEEHMLFEDGKYYTMMKVVSGRSYSLSETEALYGRILLRERPQVFLDYLRFEYDKGEKLLQRLDGAQNERTLQRRKEVEKLQRSLRDLLMM